MTHGCILGMYSASIQPLPPLPPPPPIPVFPDVTINGYFGSAFSGTPDQATVSKWRESFVMNDMTTAGNNYVTVQTASDPPSRLLNVLKRMSYTSPSEKSLRRCIFEKLSTSVRLQPNALLYPYTSGQDKSTIFFCFRMNTNRLPVSLSYHSFSQCQHCSSLPGKSAYRTNTSLQSFPRTKRHRQIRGCDELGNQQRWQTLHFLHQHLWHGHPDHDHHVCGQL